MLLDVCEDLAGCGLEPFSVQLFCRYTKLNDQIAGKILRFSFAAFLAPKPKQCAFIIPHDDSGVGPTNKPAAVLHVGQHQGIVFKDLAVQVNCDFELIGFSEARFGLYDANRNRMVPK